MELQISSFFQIVYPLLKPFCQYILKFHGLTVKLRDYKTSDSLYL